MVQVYNLQYGGRFPWKSETPFIITCGRSCGRYPSVMFLMQDIPTVAQNTSQTVLAQHLQTSFPTSILPRSAVYKYTTHPMLKAIAIKHQITQGIMNPFLLLASPQSAPEDTNERHDTRKPKISRLSETYNKILRSFEWPCASTSLILGI